MSASINVKQGAPLISYHAQGRTRPRPTSRLHTRVSTIPRESQPRCPARRMATVPSSGRCASAPIPPSIRRIGTKTQPERSVLAEHVPKVTRTTDKWAPQHDAKAGRASVARISTPDVSLNARHRQRRPQLSEPLRAPRAHRARTHGASCPYRRADRYASRTRRNDWKNTETRLVHTAAATACLETGRTGPTVICALGIRYRRRGLFRRVS